MGLRTNVTATETKEAKQSLATERGIGEAAGIVVQAEDARTGRPTKYASAHDLRRSCGDRLRNAGVPPLVICRVMRHSSWKTTRKHYAPGDVQRDAEVLHTTLTADATKQESKGDRDEG